MFDYLYNFYTSISSSIFHKNISAHYQAIHEIYKFIVIIYYRYGIKPIVMQLQLHMYTCLYIYKIVPVATYY